LLKKIERKGTTSLVQGQQLTKKRRIFPRNICPRIVRLDTQNANLTVLLKKNAKTALCVCSMSQNGQKERMKIGYLLFNCLLDT